MCSGVESCVARRAKVHWCAEFFFFFFFPVEPCEVRRAKVR